MQDITRIKINVKNKLPGQNRSSIFEDLQGEDAVVHRTSDKTPAKMTGVLVWPESFDPDLVAYHLYRSGLEERPAGHIDRDRCCVGYASPSCSNGNGMVAGCRAGGRLEGHSRATRAWCGN